jgi:gliding motility-associated-like protein
MYSQANPALTFTDVSADFVNGDNAATITAPVATTTATAASNAGTYPITVTGSTLNYNFVVTNGTLTITKAVLTATADDQSRIYGEPNPPFTITYTGFVNGESVAQIATFPTPSTTATPQTNAGSYPIDVSGGGATNYNFTYVSGKVVVNKATLTATADNKSRLFDSPNPPFTIRYSGFVNGETQAVIDTPPVASTSATTKSPVGDYGITVSSGADDNYNFIYVSGTLSVLSSFPPGINDLQIATNEDSRFVFNYEQFSQHFLGYPGDSIIAIKIVQPPANGDLFWAGKKIAPGDQISTVHGKLSDFSYMPNPDYNGPDAVTWNVFDGTFTATADARIAVTVIPVNDAPGLSNMESEPILYRAGDDPVAITTKVHLTDIDNNFMFSARIALTGNYKNGDLLSLGGGPNSTISAAFNSVKGELLLSGKDSKANYETALHNVLFSRPVTEDTSRSIRTVALSVNDSIDDSNVVSRIITITTKVIPEFSIVNAFTPNNDGFNDYWDFVNLQLYTKIEISVFDQNGIRVFDCGDQDCKWDGKNKGRELPAGLYFYTINLDSGKWAYRGTVTILK